MKTLAILFIFYFSGLSFVPCDTDIFHSEIKTECSSDSPVHDDENHDDSGHQHEDGASHCACHCHHIQAYFQIAISEVVSENESDSHSIFYQNRANDSHLHGLFKPPKV